MKNVSNAFKKVIKDGGPFYAYAKVTLSNGTQLELNSRDDFYIDGNNYTESSESGFPLGAAIAKTIDIGIDNSDERFSNYDFYYAQIAFYTEADLEDGRTERILEGTFTVVDSIVPGDTIEFTASNDMYKADITYVPKASFPTTALIFLKDVCTQCGIRLGDASFVNDDFEIRQKPDGLTCRQAIGYVAQIAGGNAVVDANNNLHIKSYQSLGITSTDLISGGTFKQELNKKISGGVFGQDADYLITSGDFNTTDNYIMLTDFTSDPDVGTDDVIITGLSTEVEVKTEEGSSETSTLLYGTDDYCLKIDNPLIKGNEEKALRMIGDILIGLSVRPFSGSFFPNPTIEFMDPVYLVDRKNNVYRSFVSSFTFNYLGDCTVSNDTESPERNKGIYYSNATEVYRKAKEEVQKNKTEWEKAVEGLGNRLDNTSGLYPTKVKQPDGSTIYYLHDKPTLEESEVVIKITAQAFGVSTDGGETYPVGLTVDGEAIIKILQTIGVNADWINTGTLVIKDPDGNVMFSADTETGIVRIVAQSFLLSGKTIEQIADEQVNSFVSSVYDPKIAELQKQIDGQIETFYYDYEPSLNNEPASEWITETERQKHEGDLFYWKSKGYAYRFFRDGNTWKWQMVQDTDVTKALQQAAEAQNTADSKRRVFLSTPVPPYDEGDLWTQGADGDIMTCINSRKSGVYVSTDWEKANKYTDDSAVEDLDDSLDQQGVFDRLTNNGQTQGIYLIGDKLYINADYIKSGKLSANYIEGGTLVLGGSVNGRLVIKTSTGSQIGYIDNTGVNFEQGTFSGRLVAATGTFSGTLSAASGTFKGEVSSGGTSGPNVTINDGIIALKYVNSTSGYISGRDWNSNADFTSGYKSVRLAGIEGISFLTNGTLAVANYRASNNNPSVYYYGQTRKVNYVSKIQATSDGSFLWWEDTLEFHKGLLSSSEYPE